MKFSREVKIAAVFIVALVLFYWGFNYLKGKSLFSSDRTYYAVYNKVNGLVESDPVVVNGLKVGKVKKITFLPDGSGRLIVEFVVNNDDIFISSNSIALLASSGLLEAKAIEIKLGDSDSPAADGDTLKTELETSLTQEVSEQMMPIKQKFEDVMLSIDSVLVIIRSIFNENTRNNLALSFESIKITLQSLEHTTYNIDTLVSAEKYRLSSIIGNVESISLNIKKNNDKITNIITNFSNISDTIAKANLASTITNADKTLKEFSEIVEKINNGEGSLGLLVNNDSLYRNLEATSDQMNQLVEDIKLNPKRYLHFSVFGGGKKNEKYSAPKK